MLDWKSTLLSIKELARRTCKKNFVIGFAGSAKSGRSLVFTSTRQKQSVSGNFLCIKAASAREAHFRISFLYIYNFSKSLVNQKNELFLKSFLYIYNFSKSLVNQKNELFRKMSFVILLDNKKVEKIFKKLVKYNYE